MKAWNYVSVLTVGALAAVVSVAACGGDDETTDGGTGGTSASSSSVAVVSSSASGTPTSSSGGGGEGNTGTGGVCESGLSYDGDTDNPVVDGCLTEFCCDSFDPCVADADCNACLQDPTFEGCDANPLFTAFQTCRDMSCPTAICGTELGTTLLNLNACLNTSCCESFNPCEADAACNACLQAPDDPACAANALFTTYTTCRDTSCPTDICDTGIQFVVTYESNDAQDVAIDTNICADTNCCTDLTACADPSNNGVMEMNDPEVDACLLCLNADPNCVGGAVETAANAFNTCMETNCPR